MSSHLVFNGVDDVVKAATGGLLGQEAAEAGEAPGPLPRGSPGDPADRQPSRHDPQHEFYKARGVVILPTGTLAAEATDDDPQAVVDRIADKLVEEIRRHKEKVRRIMSTNAGTATGPTSARPGRDCKSTAEAGNRDDFFRMLRPHLGFLRDYARREIRMLEQDGTLHRGELTVNDLLDQVVLLAYERFKDRPRKVSLDLWLTDLVDDALEQWIKQEPRPHVSLEDRAEKFLPAESPRDDDDPWWAELMDEEERLRLEDLIPDPRETDALDEPGGGGAEGPSAGPDRQAAAGAAAGLPAARPGGLRDGRDRHAPGPARERGQGGHRGGSAVAEEQLQAEGLVGRGRASRPHRPARSRRSRPGDGQPISTPGRRAGHG